MQATLTIGTLAGPLPITVGYVALWYFLLIGLQRRTKYRLKREYAERGEVFDRYFGQDEEMLAVDRVVINTQEQMVPFLLALWLHTLFVSATAATVTWQKTTPGRAPRATGPATGARSCRAPPPSAPGGRSPAHGRSARVRRSAVTTATAVRRAATDAQR